MMKRIVPVLALVCLLSACSEKKTDAPAADAQASAPAAQASGTATAPVTPVKTAAAPSGSMGVPECDSYFDKIQACLNDKVPAAQRAAFENSLEQTRKSWETFGTDKAALAKACKTASEQVKATYAAVGCSM